MAVVGQEALQRRAQGSQLDEEEEGAVSLRTPLNQPNQAAMARGNVVYSGGVSAPNNQQGVGNFQTNPVAFGSSQVGQFNPQTMGRNFDFDAAYEAGVNQLNQQLAQIGSSREGLLRRLGEDFTTARGGLTRDRDRVLDQNTVNMADRGILRSGANIQEQADIGEEYSRAVDLMGRDRARMEGDVESQYSSAYQQLANLMDQLERDRASAQERRDEMRAQEEAERRAAEEAAKQRAAEEARLRQEAEERRAAQQRQERLLREAAEAARRPQPSPSGSYNIGGGGGGSAPRPAPQPAPQQPRPALDARTIRDIQSNYSNLSGIEDRGDGTVEITTTSGLSGMQQRNLRRQLEALGFNTRFTVDNSALSRRLQSAPSSGGGTSQLQ